MTGSAQDRDYAAATSAHQGALQRLARAYEADPERRKDLLQDIHVALWRSFATFDCRCAVSTWVYRVAHNVGASHIVHQRRHTRPLCGLEQLDSVAAEEDLERSSGERQAMTRLLDLIRALKPLDREVMLLFLEGLGSPAIAEITGLTPGGVSVKIHRIKAVLAQQFQGTSV